MDVAQVWHAHVVVQLVWVDNMLMLRASSGLSMLPLSQKTGTLPLGELAVDSCAFIHHISSLFITEADKYVFER